MPRRPVLHPFLAAVYLVVFLAVSNSSELVRRSDLLIPLLTALGVAAAGTLAGQLVTGDRHRGGLFGLLVVLLFSRYGFIAGGLYLAFGNEFGARWEPALLALLLGALAAAGYLLRRWAMVGPRATLALTWLFGLLLAFNVVLFTLQLRGPQYATAAEQPPTAPRRAPAGDTRPPDIYLIIPDKYSGSALLAREYGFDNRAVVEALQRRGFTMPRAPRANYPHTFLALASMLNLRYLDEFPDHYGRDNIRWHHSYPHIWHNDLVRLLRSYGYRYVFLPTPFGATRHSPDADIQIPAPEEIQPEFLLAWRRTTMLPILHRAYCGITGCTVTEMPYVPETASLVDWKFRQLATLSLPDRPTFVLAHFTVPHEPYVYGPTCEHRTPFWPAVDSGAVAPRVRQAYLDQIQCVNRRLVETVDGILANAHVPPVILIQADHGHGLLGPSLPGLSATTPPQVDERLSVFAAYLFPGAERVSDTITPINAVRAALRGALGEKLPELPDKSYWSSAQYAYDLKRIR